MNSSNWVGTTIGGRYKIEALLGQGGMSAVYRAYDPNLRRTVAIKLIHPHLSTDPNFVGRFREEAAAVARLRHPNIVQVHDFNLDGDTYYMVMEYLVGETLLTRLKRLNSTGRHMSFAEAIKICLQICDAAGYAHDHELIHRDIKPANIMLDVNGQAILMDFGIVKIMGGEYHTATGATIGTAMYMSPEQIRGERVTDLSDIYSLGVTFYEMISGQPPYQADSTVTLMMMVLNDPLPDIRKTREDVQEPMLAVIYKALAKDKAGRYRSMPDMAAALRQLQPGLEDISALGTIAAENKAKPVLSRGTSTFESGADQRTLPETVNEPSQPETGLESTTRDRALQNRKVIAPTAAPDQEIQGEPIATPVIPAIPQAKKAFTLNRRFVLPIAGGIFILALIIAGYFYLSSRQPPKLTLAAITSSSIPIDASTAKNIVHIGKWDVGSYVTDLAFSPDGKFLATANDRDWVQFTQYHYYSGLWQVDTGKLEKYLFGPKAWVNGVAFSPDGQLIASGSDDYSVYLWTLPSGDLFRKVETSLGGIRSVDFSPNNKLLAAGSSDGYVGLWQVSNGNLLRTLKDEGSSFKDVQISPDGSMLTAALENGLVQLWSVSDGSLLQTFDGHTSAAYKVTFSPDGSLLASASEDQKVLIWRVKDGKLLHTLQGHTRIVTDVAFSPDGSVLASGSEDGTIRLWQVSNGETLSVLPEDEGILSVAFSPNGDSLAAGGWGNWIYFLGISEAIPPGNTPHP